MGSVVPESAAPWLDGQQCQMPTCLQHRCKAVNPAPGHEPKDKMQGWEPRDPTWTSPIQDLPLRVVTAGARTLPGNSRAGGGCVCARFFRAHLSCSRSCVSFRRAFRCLMQTSFCCRGVRYCSGVGGFIPWLSLQRLYLAERLRGHRRHPPAGAGAGTGSAEGPQGRCLLSGCRGVHPCYASQRSPAGGRGRAGVSGCCANSRRVGTAPDPAGAEPSAEPRASPGRRVHEQSQEQAGAEVSACPERAFQGMTDANGDPRVGSAPEEMETEDG